jgi:phage tail-like protein
VITFSNREYLYQHLPARVRRDDDGLFWKRFLTFFGETLDVWDAVYDDFYKQIDPATASEEFIDWWLWSLFGWSWYPAWFTLARKRHLYAEFATHLARRGTWIGIENWLREFSIFASVYSRPLALEEAACGEEAWAIDDALGIAVQVRHLADEVNLDVRGQAFEELCFEEGYMSDTLATLTRSEIEELLRFQWPNAHRLMIEYRTRRNLAGPEAWNSGEVIFNEDLTFDENSGTFLGA